MPKYFKRTGTKGNYKYYYTKNEWNNRNKKEDTKNKDNIDKYSDKDLNVLKNIFANCIEDETDDNIKKWEINKKTDYRGRKVIEFLSNLDSNNHAEVYVTIPQDKTRILNYTVEVVSDASDSANENMSENISDSIYDKIFKPWQKYMKTRDKLLN